MKHLKLKIAVFIEWLYLSIPCEWHQQSHRHAEKWTGGASIVGGAESTPYGRAQI